MNAQPTSPLREALILLVADAIGFVACFSLVHRLRIGVWLTDYGWSLVALGAVTLMALYILDVYHSEPEEPAFTLGLRTLLAVAMSGAVIAAVVYVVEPWDTNPLFWRSVLPFAMLLFALWASLWRVAVSRWSLRRASGIQWLVLGAGQRAVQLRRDFRAQKGRGRLHFLEARNGERSSEWAEDSKSLIGDLSALESILHKGWTGVIVASEEPLPDRVINLLMSRRLRGMRVLDLTDFYENFLSKVPILHLQDGWFALSHGFDLLHHNVELRIKRIMDVVFALVLFVVLLPLMALIALLVRIDSPGPIIYSQTRTGLNGREFRVHKFRTMVRDAERLGVQWAAQNDPRVTRIGGVLRRMRLDELPQLWNVLLGEMSFIGPRPERPDFNRKLELEIPYYDLRHLVKPGITGWAQVMYSYGASVEDAREKLQYDLYYIKNYSIALDIFIVFKTVRVMLFGRGR
jgi:exopolysaccharide biosynthesis polyprenyl glycosylphosphotransferase